MMTVCAGRLTPQASVAVQQSTLMWPCEKRRSVRLRSLRSMPAWWWPKPRSNSALSCPLRDFCTSFFTSAICGFSSSSAKSSESPGRVRRGVVREWARAELM